MIRDENYYTVQGWMRNRLSLKGNDLHVYAMLYSFSQDGASEFRGSLDYMVDFIGAGELTIRRSLIRLEEKGLIEKINYNEKTGKTNGFKCIPLSEIDRVFKMNTPVVQNEQGGIIKMNTPVVQNEHPIPYINIYNKVGNKVCKKERKEEMEKKDNQGKNSIRLLDFSKMSIEELVDFGDKPVDFSDEIEAKNFSLWQAEMEKRSRSAEWSGKVVKSGDRFERLKSHAQIIVESGCSIALREELMDWLRSCYKNGHLIINSYLQQIIYRLQDKYGNNDAMMCEVVRNATESGYVRIVV